MPFRWLDRKDASALAREAEKFARQIRSIPVAKDAPPHPEIRDVLEGFKRINAHLKARNAAGEVTMARKHRVGREFQKMGTALRKRRAPRARKR